MVDLKNPVFSSDETLMPPHKIITNTFDGIYFKYKVTHFSNISRKNWIPYFCALYLKSTFADKEFRGNATGDVNP